MRKLVGAASSESLGSFLGAIDKQNIEIDLQKNDDGSWDVWILDEDHFEKAKSLYDQRTSEHSLINPETFLKQKQKLAPKAKPKKSQWQKNLTPGWVTTTIIILCLGGSTLVQMAKISKSVLHLPIAEWVYLIPGVPSLFAWIVGAFAADLVSIFFQSSVLNLIFSLFAIYIFGNEVEQQEGSAKLGTLVVLVIAITVLIRVLLSVLANADFAIPPTENPGQMTILIHALLGHSLGMQWWAYRLSYNAGSGFLPFFLFWMVLSMIGVLPSMAMLLPLFGFGLGIITAKLRVTWSNRKR
jgi:membrane associated rhomboid family serine protease